MWCTRSYSRPIFLAYRNGNAYFDFTATGEHDLTGLEACDKAIDLTSKGCTFKVDKIYDNNPDWIIDKENWTTQKVNSITLKFTYPKSTQ